MKKLILILLTLGTTSAFAQYGNNAYYGGNTNTGYTGTTYTGGSTTASYSGGYNTVNDGGTRIRFEASPCGTFQWRIEETSYWVPGAWSYVNGCQTWVNPYMAWTPVYRTRVYNNHSCYNGCGHQVGYYTYANGCWSNAPVCGPRPVYTYNNGYHGGHHGGGYGHGGYHGGGYHGGGYGGHGHHR